MNEHDRRELERLLRVAASRPMNRRGFLAALGATGFLAACGTGAASPSPTANRTQAPSSAPGTSTGPSPSAAGVVHDQVEPEFNLYNWVDYDAPETIEGFETEYKTTITYTVYGSNEEALAKFQAGGGTGFDMLAPTGYIIPSFIAGNYLQKIDRSRIGNYGNLDPKFLNMPFDPQSDYYVPKDWGTTGFMYRSSEVTETPATWKDFFALGPKYSGKIGLLDDKPVNIGAALKSLGYPINSVDPAQLDAAAEVLYAFAPHVGNVSSDYKDVLRNKDMLIHQGWNGDAAVLKAEAGNEDTVYVVPTDGTEFWIDAWVLVADAPHPNAAYAWLDYLLRPEVAVQETGFTLYGCVVQAAYDSLPDAIRNDPTIFPPEDVVAKLEAFVDNEANEQRNDIWATFRSRIGA